MRRRSSQRLSELYGLEPELLLFRVRRCHLPHGVNLEVKTFALLKVADDLKQVTLEGEDLTEWSGFEALKRARG